MRKSALAFFVAALISNNADAAFTDGNELYRMCQGDQMAALKFSLGVYDATDALGRAGLMEKLICLPDNVNAGQILDIACQYQREKPQIRHLNAASATINALSTAFPCK